MQNVFLIKPKFSSSAESYWAMFYCSVIKTIVHQGNLKYKFRGHSLSDYKGMLIYPANFFHSMKEHIYNHGFEYLMIDYLRSSDGQEVRDTLISSLLRQFDLGDFEVKYLNIFKLGLESNLYDEISKYNDPEIKVLAPKKEYLFQRNRSQLLGFTYPLSNIAKTFLHSDLLIMISDGRNTYGFVGEVEGNHGERIFRNSYFSDNEGIKGRYTTFAIGASDRKKKAGEIHVKDNIILLQDEYERWLLHFSNSNHFVESFKHAVSNLELCLGGHFSNIVGLDASHSRIFSLIKLGWQRDIYEIVAELESLIEYDVDIKEYYYQNEDATYKPSVIALGNEFYLHKIKQIKQGKESYDSNPKIFL